MGGKAIPWDLGVSGGVLAASMRASESSETGQEGRDRCHQGSQRTQPGYMQVLGKTEGVRCGIAKDARPGILMISPEGSLRTATSKMAIRHDFSCRQQPPKGFSPFTLSLLHQLKFFA